jgi:putative ABC transport system permease protein
VESLLHDVRYGARSLAKDLGTTAVVVLTLALAMGSSAVIFSAVDTVLHGAPVKDPSRVVYLASTDRQRGRDRTGVSVPDLADWEAQNRSFQELAAFTFGTFNLSGIDVPVRVSALRASADLLRLWGMKPILGRGFLAEEDVPGRDRVVVLTNGFWRRQFGADPGILGRSVTLNGEPHTVIGVLPAEIDVGVLRQIDLWVPLARDVTRSPRDQRSLFIVGLLEAGVTMQQAGADIDGIARRLERQYPETNAGIGAVALPVVEILGGGNVRFVAALLSLMAVLVVVIASANVANAILAKCSARRRELSIRTALGASRFRLVRQLMIEALILSSLGGGVGLLLCAWGLDAIRAVAGADMPVFSEMTINTRVLVFGLLLALVTPLLFGLLPAARSSSVDTREGLKEGARSAGGLRGRRLREILVVCQVALALTLSIEIGLLVRTTLALRNMEKGFDPRNLLTLRIDLPASKYEAPDQLRDLFTRLIERTEELPGVRSAGAISRLPIADRELPGRFAIEGQPPQTPNAQPWAAHAIITPAYRRTMGIALIKGRDFALTDSASAPPVALISQLAAHRYWPDQEPIGRRIRVVTTDSSNPWLEIVGIVGDVRNSDPDAGLIPQIYVPLSQSPTRTMAIVARTESDPLALTAAIRAEVLNLDKDQPIYAVRSMDQVLYDDLAGTFILAGILVALALIAVGLAASGIYAVIAYSVAQRTHEIGIRMALGARARTVLTMVLTQGFVPILVGALAGLGGGFVLARLTSSALREMNPTDPATYVGVSVFLGTVVLLASYLPARRATAVDPIVALRAE